MPDNLMRRVSKIALRALVWGVLLIAVAVLLLLLVAYLFPGLDFGPLASRIAVIVIPEALFVMIMVVLWRKRRPAGIGIMITVRRCPKAVEFYESVFGAVVTYGLDRPEGIVLAHLTVGESGFWISDEASEFSNSSPETLGGTSARLVLTVSDPDAVFVRAIAAGATEVHPVINKHGHRVGRVLDPFGHQWEISRSLSR